jgi:peptidoglycan hydrolase-like protein with peptidoglycan-binding domain
MLRGERLQLVERAIVLGEDPHVSAVRALLHGPTGIERRDGVRSAIPRGTQLSDLAVFDGVAYVRLTERFATGDSGRSALLRRTQLVYTLTAYRDTRAVRILIGQEPMTPGADPPTALLTRGSFPRRSVIPPLPITVAEVQRALASLTFLPGRAVTGRLDYRTSQALLAFEGWLGLPRDGAAGLRVRERLVRTTVPSPRNAGGGRWIEVDRARGVLLLVDGGRVIRAIHVSPGVGGRTPTGRFRVRHKERMSWSRPFHVWMPWAVYFSGGYAMHEYPYVPAYPASHGCIRIGPPEARGVYDFAAIGMPVWVF